MSAGREYTYEIRVRAVDPGGSKIQHRSKYLKLQAEDSHAAVVKAKAWVDQDPKFSKLHYHTYSVVSVA